MAALNAALAEYAAASKANDLPAIKAAAAKVSDAAAALAAAMRAANSAPVALSAEVRHVESQVDVLVSTGKALSTCVNATDCQPLVHQFTGAYNDAATSTSQLTSTATAPPPGSGDSTSGSPPGSGSGSGAGSGSGSTTTAAPRNATGGGSTTTAPPAAGGTSGGTSTTTPPTGQTPTTTASGMTQSQWTTAYGGDADAVLDAMDNVDDAAWEGDAGAIASSCSAYIKQVDVLNSRPAPPDQGPRNALATEKSQTTGAYSYCKSSPTSASEDTQDSLDDEDDALSSAVSNFDATIGR
jgi:hypothetical protein